MFTVKPSRLLEYYGSDNNCNDFENSLGRLEFIDTHEPLVHLAHGLFTIVRTSTLPSCCTFIPARDARVRFGS
jgi:hypothetical protein